MNWIALLGSYKILWTGPHFLGLIMCEYEFTKPTLNCKSQTTSIKTQVFVGVIQLIITLLLFLFCQYYTQKSGVLTIPKFTVPT